MRKQRDPDAEPDAIEEELENQLNSFGLTLTVVAKADESKGHWYYINQLRQQIYNLHQLDRALNRKINGVKNAEVVIDDSGIYRAWERKNETVQMIRRKTWQQWAAIATAVTGLIGSAGTGIWWLIVHIKVHVQ
jgi:hypothetical protein